MSEVNEYQEEPQLIPPGVGERLRTARKAAGMDLEQVAAETRIPQRHLKAIEEGNLGALPARTYAVGFSRSYARLVGLDEKEIAAQVRQELANNGDGPHDRSRQFEPGDPARLPASGLAWLAAGAIILLLVGGFSFYRSYFVPGAGPGSLVTEEQAAARQAAAQQAAAATIAPKLVEPTGEVVFTALEDGVWAKFYDAQGKRLFEKQMAKGERFAVPADVQGPQIWTGRPEALGITIGGKPVPKLAEQQSTMKDVAIDAKSLLARSAPPASAASPAATPAAPAASGVDNSAT